ncbi:hypothetical protein ACFWIJ_40140 [Streptomyces sp. NPDC127079]|uniref:hypothetical protein n=1 Tax=Streptomyces sp. NPDC127079 TaxID=3347132 RepID=UPI00365E2627
MNPTLKRLLGVTAAVATGMTALIGTGAVPAGARAAEAHCDRAERPVWKDQGPSRNITGHHCSLPEEKRRWYTVEIDTLVQPHYRTDYQTGAVDRTETLHDRTVRCLGYTVDHSTVNWFGCPAG